MFEKSRQIIINTDGCKARMLCQFIIKECDCDLLYAFSDNITEIKHNDITFKKLFFKPKDISIEQKFVPDESGEFTDVLVFYPFDDDGEALPLIEYFSTKEENNEMLTIRLYYSPISMPVEFHKTLEGIFKKISVWLRKNSINKQKEGPITVYCL